MRAPLVQSPYQRWRQSIRVFASAVHMIAGSERWNGKHVRVKVCPLCNYMPINGEEALAVVCSHCKLGPAKGTYKDSLIPALL
jgi:hypothetical protein